MFAVLPPYNRINKNYLQESAGKFLIREICGPVILCRNKDKTIYRQIVCLETSVSSAVLQKFLLNGPK